MAPIVVCFSGTSAKSGKDTAADFLQRYSERKYHRVSFAWQVRKTLELLTDGKIRAENTVSDAGKGSLMPVDVIGTTRQEVVKRIQTAFAWTNRYDVLDNLKIMNQAVDILCDSCNVDSANGDDIVTLAVVLKEGMTVGRMLQLLGTEIGRNMFDDNIWVNVIRDYWVTNNYPSLIITDARFPNELEWVNSLPNNIRFLVDAQERLPIKSSEIVPSLMKDGRFVSHASEIALRNHQNKFSTIIDNNGPLENLESQIKDLVTKFNL